MFLMSLTDLEGSGVPTLLGNHPRRDCVIATACVFENVRSMELAAFDMVVVTSLSKLERIVSTESPEVSSSVATVRQFCCMRENESVKS